MSDDDTPRASEAGRGGPLRNWRIRTKLGAILVIPLLALGVFVWFGASGLVKDSRSSGQVAQLAKVGGSITGLVDGLQRERTLVVARVAGGKNLDAPIAAQRKSVDAELQAFDSQASAIGGGYNKTVRTTLADATTAVARLSQVRSTADVVVDPDSAESQYEGMIGSLNGVLGGIAQGTTYNDLAQSVRSLDDISQAKEFLAKEQSLLYSTLSTDSKSHQFTPPDFRQFFTSDFEESDAESSFTDVATTRQGDLLHTLDASKQLVSTSTQTAYANQNRDDLGIKAAAWLSATNKRLDALKQVQSSVLGDVTHQADTIRNSARSRALLEGVIILVVLALAVLATVVVARSIIRPLLALRSGALDVADHRLPDAVRRLRETGGEAPELSVDPIPVDSREEIGEVARAFDAVHREAVHLATEQAALRNNVSSMFVNLSRRSQSLVERQLRLIDELENRERDPDQLSNLFKLDHLATRMRRNDENLLVLSGTEAARRWTHPVPVSEVVLAAISEVEQYTRISHTATAPQAISGNAVADIVHLVAELLENATAFSPPTTDVTVTSHALTGAGGAMIEIEDSGIGIPPRELEQINERLVNPPVVDVSVSRTMGLFVVGRLATRHGVRVQLRESPTGGITALVRLPAKLTVNPANPAGQQGQPALPATGRTDQRPARPTPALPATNGSAPASNGSGRGTPGTTPHRIDPRSAGRGIRAGGLPIRAADPNRPVPGGQIGGPADGTAADTPDPRRRGDQERWAAPDDRYAGRGRDGDPLADGPATTGVPLPPRAGDRPAAPADGARSGRPELPAGPTASDPLGVGDLAGDEPPTGVLPRTGEEPAGEPPAGGRQDRDTPRRRGELAAGAIAGAAAAGTRGDRTRGDQPDDPATGGRRRRGVDPDRAAADRAAAERAASDRAAADRTAADRAAAERAAADRAAADRAAADRAAAAERAAADRAAADRAAADRAAADRAAAGDRATGERAAAERAAAERGLPGRGTPARSVDRFGGERTAAERAADRAARPGDPADGRTPDRAPARRGPAPMPRPAAGRGLPTPRPTAQPARPVRAEATHPVGGSDAADDPVVREALDAAGLPIFESVSEWFRRRTPAARPEPPAAGAGAPVAREPRRDGDQPGQRVDRYGPPPPRAARPTRPERQPRAEREDRYVPPELPEPVPEPQVEAPAADWQSPGDDGWRAAEAAVAPRPGGTTKAGLPKRVPMTNLVPGSADAPSGARPEAGAAARSPELVGSRLASYYRGVREGRGASAADGDNWPRQDQENT